MKTFVLALFLASCRTAALPPVISNSAPVTQEEEQRAKTTYWKDQCTSMGYYPVCYHYVTTNGGWLKCRCSKGRVPDRWFCIPFM